MLRREAARSRACVVCTLFSPKVKPSKGKKKGEKRHRRPPRPRPNTGHTRAPPLTHSRSHGHGHCGHGRRSGHEERAKSYGRSLARGRRHISNRRERERTVRPLFSASPSQGFFDVADADVKEGRKEPLAAPRERAMHEEVIPDTGDAGHFTIGTDREEQNVGKKFRESFGRGVSFPARSRDAISANSPNPTSR